MVSPPPVANLRLPQVKIMILLLLFLYFVSLVVHPCLCFSETIALPLKKETLQSPRVVLLPRKLSTNRIVFQHNVSLTVSLTIGSPPQLVTMVLDTGSELSWLRSNKTLAASSIFTPTASSTYSPIPCSSPVCMTQTRDFPIPVSCDSRKLCHSILSYADSTSIEGNLASDTFRIGNSDLPGMVFGSMESGFSSNANEDVKTTGLMGMNLGSLSFVSQMKVAKFSYCISGRDSTGVLVFGDVGNQAWLNSLTYTPMVRISTPLPYFDRLAYTVQLEGVKVGNTLLPLPKSAFIPDHTGAGQTMIDSGTQFTFVLGPIYTALKNEFINQTRGVLTVFEDTNFVFQGVMDLCYRVPLVQPSLPPLPVVTMMFTGAEMRVPAERLMYRVENMVRGSDGIWCFTFANSDLQGIEANLIGHHHQQNVWVEFDLAKSRIGLAEVGCDFASQQMGLDS